MPAQQHNSVQKRKNQLMFRWMIFILAAISFTVAAIAWFLSSGNIIPAVWSYFLMVLFGLAGILLTLWGILFPLPPLASKNMEVESSKFSLVQNLRSRSLNLGDDTAANFPYVIAPLENVYNRTIRMLQNASAQTTGSKRGVLLIGESNAGKTRLAYETIKAALPDWHVLRWRPDYIVDTTLVSEASTKGNMVLFIDDLQDFISPEHTHDHRSIALRTLIEILLQNVQHIVIVATCRIEDKADVQAELDWLLDQLAIVNVPSFNANKEDPQSLQVITEFQKQGAVLIDDWDGTLGSLVLGLSRKNSQYYALKKSQANAAAVLRSMKLLRKGWTFNHTERRVRAVCAGVFGEKGILERENIWRSVVDTLQTQQFITVDTNAAEKMLVIRKDTYFEKVVTDYTCPYQDFIRLREVLSELKDAEALAELGIAFIAMKHYEDAIISFDQALFFRPDDVQSLLNKGVTLSQLERYHEALAIYNQIIITDPKDALGLNLNKGSVLLHLSLYEEALKVYEQALANFNQAPPSLYSESILVSIWSGIGQTLHKLDRYGESLTAFDAALEIDPKNDAVWYHKGHTLLDQGRYADALAAFKEAISIDSTKASSWCGMGQTLMEEGQYEDALDAYNRALEMDPRHEYSLANKSAALFHLKRFNEMLDACEEGLEIYPQNLTLLYNKGTALLNLERYEEEIEAFDKVLAINPEDINALLEKSAALNTLRRFQEALDVLDYTLSIDSKKFSDYQCLVLWSNRGAVLRNLGLFDSALYAFKRALTIDPKRRNVWDGLWATLQVMGRHKEAQRVKEQMRDLDS
jgi:tetratricopeptide (TPR) repeat protein